MRRRMALLLLAAGWSPGIALPSRTLPAQGEIEVAFTPGDAADRMIVEAIGRSQRSLRVQAYSLTHRRIADALIAAHRRGVDVRVIIDRGQALGHGRRIADHLARAGVNVMLDGVHEATHGKYMVIDTGTDQCAVITGSFNFTYSAQHRNAENVLVMRANPPLCDAYARDWSRHEAHAPAHRPAPR